MEARECAQTDAWLAARAAGTLDDRLLAALAAHLAWCGDCRGVADDLEVPATFAPLFPAVDAGVYELGPIIGYGGMGRIRIAVDRRIGRRVAIKELLFHTDELAARFVREARIAASLQHPNIVPVYDVGSWADGTPFYTMRLVQGRSLYEALARAASHRERMALIPAVIAAADAVAFAHTSGIVHRDLTPANILLGDFGETLVIDWGLAKDLRGDAPRVGPEFQTGLTQRALTGKGDIIGSPAYMPREQAAGEPIDARADVYALGAIVYHLLAGTAPYTGKSSKAVLARVRSEEPVPIERHAPRVPGALLSIVRTAMARDAGDRYPTARELVGALRGFTAEALAETHRGTLTRFLARYA
jgi:eukaryotic-like serine/threonine-protein kinase